MQFPLPFLVFFYAAVPFAVVALLSDMYIDQPGNHKYEYDYFHVKKISTRSGGDLSGQLIDFRGRCRVVGERCVLCRDASRS